MLAQNFMTASALGINDIQLDALIKVLGMLERSELEHTGVCQPVKNGFNMAEILHENSCGTVACLCGWAHLVSDRKAFPQVENYLAERKRPGWSKLPKELFNLFFNNTGRVSSLWNIDNSQAASALRNYLTTGKPNWSEVLAPQS
jgi:hypothetical protein